MSNIMDFLSECLRDFRSVNVFIYKGDSPASDTLRVLTDVWHSDIVLEELQTIMTRWRDCENLVPRDAEMTVGLSRLRVFRIYMGENKAADRAKNGQK